MDRVRLYDIMYALAASDGREEVLFGNCAASAREAFSRSLAGNEFPEVWFEVPLAGDPWLDFHALVAYESVAGTQASFSGQDGACADALNWFAEQQPGSVRQLALSYDTGVGNVDNPAIQLLRGRRDAAVSLGFLESVGRADAKDAYLAFVESMPPEWYDCYVGTFPGRRGADTPPWVRVECIVGDALQQAYAENDATLRGHLARVGLERVDANAIDAICELARSPFPLELQFNVGAEGRALPVISASVRFQPLDWLNAESRRGIDDLTRYIRNRGLDDGRWEQLSNAVFAKRVKRNGESAVISCFPAFLKLRWREGEPLDAKAYLMAAAKSEPGENGKA